MFFIIGTRESLRTPLLNVGKEKVFLRVCSLKFCVDIKILKGLLFLLFSYNTKQRRL